MRHYWLAALALGGLLWRPAHAEPAPALPNPWANAPGAKEFPKADAIILKDDIQAIIYPDGTNDLIEYDAIKVLNKEGIERFGRTVRFYDSKMQTSKVELARVWMPDGKMIDVPPARITDTVTDSYASHPLYKRMHLIGIDYPNPVEGSVLEFRLVHHRKVPWPGRKFWEVSYTQDFEPILDTTFTFKSPEQTQYNLEAPGSPELKPASLTRADGILTMKWSMKDRPAIVNQPAMPSLREVASQIQISNFSGWDEFSAWARQLYEQAATTEPPLVAKTASIVAGKDTDEKKVLALLAYLEKEKPSLGSDVGLDELPPFAASEDLAAPTLLSQDRSVLLLAMLKAASIKAWPVLLSTSDHGDPERGVPSLQQFNRLLLILPKTDGTLVWVDPSAPVPNVLGQGVMGRRGLVLDGGPGRFLQAPVAQPQANREEVQGVARLDPDGALEASLKIREYGANALAWLGLAGTAPRDQRQVFQLYVSGINPTGVLRDFFLQSPPPSAPGAPMEITVNFETAQGVGKERNGESYKMPLPMLKQRRLISYAETPVGQRLYPVELGANAYEERRLQIVLPEGWTVKSLPGAVTLNNAVGSFQVDVRAQDRTISYFSRVILRRPEVPLKDYADFKALMDQLNTSSEESITLNPPAAATPSPSPSPSP